MSIARPQEMSKVELVVPERDVVPVTEALAASSIFHPTLTGRLGGERTPRYGEDWGEQATTFAALERRIMAVMEALDVDEGSPPSETPHLIEPDIAQMDVERLEQETRACVQEMEKEQQRLAQLQRYVSQLEFIADLETDLDTLRNLRYLFALPGTMPAANIERLKVSLELIPSVLITLRHENHLATVMLFGTQRDAEILNRAARSAYLNPLNLPEQYQGTPAEVIAALKAGIERARQHIGQCEVDIEHLHKMHVDHLRHLLWRVRASRTLVETIARYGRLRFTYLIAGWVPASKVATLRHKIEEVSDQILVEVETPWRQEDSHIPVALENPPIVRAFQSLVTNYGHPRYGEIDPTPAVALTFPLIFGVMFGDVGHGLLLALLGLLLSSRKVRALRGLASLGVILTTCGVVAMIFGVIYGSIFGFEDILEPLWIRPIDNIMDILLTAVAGGVVVLTLGMTFNIANAALARRWGHLLFNHSGVAGMLLYWSLIGLAVRIFTGYSPVAPALITVLAIVSGLTVTFGEVLARMVDGQRPLVEGSTGTYLVQLPVELFETIIGLLSNTLSYVRMGAFAVAHGALSKVVFLMADMVNPTQGVGYWIVVVLGNLFVIGFEGMIVGIQTLRLEYYEFFSKFFSGGGMRYRPLTLIPRGEE